MSVSSTELNEANACLIAAAPDMLEALKVALRFLDRVPDELNWDAATATAAVGAAIAKAEGRS